MSVAGDAEALDRVRWHDLECGSYRVDEPLWRALAAEAAGPVLDAGAGTGRVTLDLAAAGVDVTAVDLDPALVAELERRAAAAGVAVAAHVGDLRELALDRRFAAIIVPMQTIQLLGGAEGRGRFLARAREHLLPGGVLAAALADAMEGYDPTTAVPPLPDMGEFDGCVYASRPVAVVLDGDALAIHRIREVVEADGSRATSEDVIRLDRVAPGELAAEGEAAGFSVGLGRRIPATEDYVGSTVVVLRAP